MIHYGKPHNPECLSAHEYLMKHSGNINITPGDRVLVGESLLYKNDVDTPFQSLLRPGTVIKRYGLLPYSIGDLYLGHYPDLLDIEMDDERPTGDHLMRGVFTETVKKIKPS